ncbi:murein L,D-transpeptidase catalytic domain family protein [Halomonas sp. 328]|uniref:murein L,D-transpeptidase catalytic domain family protein n=1 Tax=Halomonas sp. 328 TaxID=2776704 RepID=UPI0018A7DA16|nr:murein L,D-transpeptidase catalytic domain family protein [Halomonas sp. 328]MBF8221438.1 murein L,D-transpeptidase catalytic domain family protein [Halomonas sp. 328]
MTHDAPSASPGRSLGRLSGLLLSAALAAPALAGTPSEPLPAFPGDRSLSETLKRLAPDADARVLERAAQAWNCARPDAERLAVIDFARSANQPRLWVFDLAEQRLLFEELVSHGRGTGDEEARWFSNVPESHQSSLGLFRTLNSYYGSNGYSLRLEGLEPGVNDLAYERAIVIHGADYVSEEFIAANGRLGRSFGCPAVRQEVTYPLIDSIKEGQYLFAHYPDDDWLEHSDYLACTPSLRLAQRIDVGGMSLATAYTAREDFPGTAPASGDWLSYHVSSSQE